MAYTEIHKITATLNAALDYISSDKIEEINEKSKERISSIEGNMKTLNDSLQDSLDYAMNDKEGIVTFKTYTSFNSCYPVDNQTFEQYIIDHSARWSEQKQKDKNKKNTKDGKEVIAWHLIQSFEESIRPELANEIGAKLVDQLIPDYPCQISTHTNTEHTHNHIIFSAWDMDGKKFHNDHKAVNLIRSISDELCQEYGLHVMEDTKEMKLIRYHDNDGDIHFYEPTDRKNEMIRQREEGNISTDHVNSYRNTYLFEEKEAKKESVRTIVKRDIDYLVPQLSTFDSLLQRLKEQGYYIRDKKKNGEWLTYITYRPPTAERGVRDYTLSSDGYYKRENLEKIFRERNKEKTVSENKSLKYFDDYIVGEFDPYKELNENIRLVKDEKNGIYAKRRSVVEREIVKDIRNQYSNNGIKNYKYLSKPNSALTAKEKELLDVIQFRCNCLKFIENKDIKTFDTIQKRIEQTSGQLKKMNKAIESMKAALEKEKRLLQLPDEIEKLSYKIAANKNNEGYMAAEYIQDVKQINQYKKQLQSKGLVTPEKLEEKRKEIRASEFKFHNWESRSELINREMETYIYFNDYVKAIGWEYEKQNEREVTNEESRNEKGTNEKNVLQ